MRIPRANWSPANSSPTAARTKRPGEWVASWRLTRRQLELVARGVLPRAWVLWARRDLRALVPSDQFISRTARSRVWKDKL